MPGAGCRVSSRREVGLPLEMAAVAVPQKERGGARAASPSTPPRCGDSACQQDPADTYSLALPGREIRAVRVEEQRHVEYQYQHRWRRSVSRRWSRGGMGAMMGQLRPMARAAGAATVFRRGRESDPCSGVVLRLRHLASTRPSWDTGVVARAESWLAEGAPSPTTRADRSANIERSCSCSLRPTDQQCASSSSQMQATRPHMLPACSLGTRTGAAPMNRRPLIGMLRTREFRARATVQAAPMSKQRNTTPRATTFTPSPTRSNTP